MTRPIVSLLTAAALAMATLGTAAAGGERVAPPGNGQSAPDFDLPAVQLRIALDRLLGEHAFLLIATMRGGIENDEEFDAAAASLEANTIGIVSQIEEIYGRDAADAVGEQWRNHAAYLVDYTRAVAAGDTDAQAVAREQLDRYVADFSDLLAGAIPELPPDVVEGLISEHVEQLDQVAAISSSAYQEAYAAIRHTYAHMYTIGDGLAAAIIDQFPDRFPGGGVAFSPSVNLRITLDRVLGEHAFLAALAMRTALSDAPDRVAAADALEENTVTLTAQIDAIYGHEAASAFREDWEQHTASYLAYVDAVADDDAAGQVEAINALTVYRTTFAAFLSGANPYLSKPQLEKLLKEHTDHLLQQVKIQNEGRTADAYAAVRAAYAHTEELSSALAAAIADQFPNMFPDTAAAPPSARSPVPLIGLLLLFAASFLAIRRRRASEPR
jgi:hypothetical protein